LTRSTEAPAGRAIQTTGCDVEGTAAPVSATMLKILVATMYLLAVVFTAITAALPYAAFVCITGIVVSSGLALQHLEVLSEMCGVNCAVRHVAWYRAADHRDPGLTHHFPSLLIQPDGR
jgi:hypothetical protein